MKHIAFGQIPYAIILQVSLTEACLITIKGNIWNCGWNFLEERNIKICSQKPMLAMGIPQIPQTLQDIANALGYLQELERRCCF